MSLPKPVDLQGPNPPFRICGSEMEYSPHDRKPNINVFDKWSQAHPGIGRLATFLDNGGKAYPDVGMIEYATPECGSFEDLALQERLGEEIVLTLVQNAHRLGTLASPRAYKRTGAQVPVIVNGVALETAGYHQNLCTTSDIGNRYVPLLASYLASAPVLFGEGLVFNKGTRFSLSQKHFNITDITGSSRTGKYKPMIMSPFASYLQEEAGPEWQRIEIRCGDANMNPWTTYLKFATASLILRIVEQGISHDALKIEDPVNALHKIASDPTLRAKVKVGKKQMTGLEHQRACAEKALQMAEKIDLPKEEVEAVGQWLDLTESMIADPESGADVVGWVLKREVLDEINTRHSGDKMAVQQTDLKWEELGERGVGNKAVKRRGSSLATPEGGVQVPTCTRAIVRSTIMKKRRPISVNWRSIAKTESRTLPISNPYDNRVDFHLARYDAL